MPASGPIFWPKRAPYASREWTVAPMPADILDRRVEITGPVDRKMIINALNSGAKVFMADFEDSSTPTWEQPDRRPDQSARCRSPHHHLCRSGHGKAVQAEREGRRAASSARAAGTWRRGTCSWMASRCRDRIFDFGLYFFHNAKELLARGSGPYFYLPKMESHLEARLWNDVFIRAQENTRPAAGHHRGHRADRDHPGQL